MRIVLDAMGSDDCPAPEIQAAIQAVHTFGENIFLVGPEIQLLPQIERIGGPNSGVNIINATDTITMEDKGLALALKAKRKGSQSTMAVAMDLISTGQADAFVTAGNTGGALATAYFRLGNIPGVERPALTALFPNKTGHVIVLDIGANPEVKPENLLQFAVMGAVYASRLRGIANPRIGLLSNGEEAGKGNQLVKEAYKLLQNSNLNFVGNIEAKELFGGEVDVAVMDGFTGNILLKSSEAVARLLMDTLRSSLMSSVRTKIGALLSKPAFNQVRAIMDPAEVGAVPLLGVNGLVFIGHGRSDARALLNAIRNARLAVDSGLLAAVKYAIQDQLTSMQKLSPSKD